MPPTLQRHKVKLREQQEPFQASLWLRVQCTPSLPQRLL